jgi:macrodomain Ter protein organizer (MatP/YcbG family)
MHTANDDRVSRLGGVDGAPSRVAGANHEAVSLPRRARQIDQAHRQRHRNAEKSC